MSEQKLQVNNDHLPQRLEACRVLFHAGIPFCIWGEDALEKVGVPTFTFSLYLLVPNVDAAAQKLREEGYVKGHLAQHLEDIWQFENLYQAPGETPGSSRIVLLPAKDWFFELPMTPSRDVADWYPPLPRLYLGLVKKWLHLDEEDSGLRIHLCVLIEYMYDYLDEVKTADFAERLPEEYRQLHMHLLKMSGMGNLATFNEQSRYYKLIYNRDNGVDTE